MLNLDRGVHCNKTQCVVFSDVQSSYIRYLYLDPSATDNLTDIFFFAIYKYTKESFRACLKVYLISAVLYFLFILMVF